MCILELPFLQTYKVYKKAVDYDRAIKRVLRRRGLFFKTVATQQANQAILKRGLESFGLRTNLKNHKHKAFRSETLVFAS